jgi:Domain of unknown function (DUF6429)
MGISSAGRIDVYDAGNDVMEIDTDKIDGAVLALLYLTLHDRFRAWRGFDWDAMDRLYRKGLIYDPVGKAKSVIPTNGRCAIWTR